MLSKISLLILFFGALIIAESNVFAAVMCPNIPAAFKNMKTVDLRSEIGPIRDQDSVGWCSGFTTADLVSHYLYKKNLSLWNTFGKKIDYRKPENMVSGVGTQQMFSFDWNKDFYTHLENAKDSNDLSKRFHMSTYLDGGSVPRALDSIKKDGICFEKDVSSKNYGNVKDLRCAQKNQCNIDEVLKIIYDSGNENCCQNYSLIQKMFPSLTLENIKNILRYNEKRNALRRLMSLGCGKPVSKGYLWDSNKLTYDVYIVKEPDVIEKKNNSLPAPKPAPSVAKSSAPVFNKWVTQSRPIDIDGKLPVGKLMEKLDEMLDKGNPVAIAYGSNILKYPNAEGKTGHASSIIGKYFNPKTCEVEYILRNSWGANCGAVSKENPQLPNCVANSTGNSVQEKFMKQRECRSKFPPVMRNPRLRCDPNTGYIFIPRAVLAPHVSMITTITGP